MRHACVTCLAAVVASLAGAAPPALTVTPPSPVAGDVVTVAGKSPLTFSVRGVGDTLKHPNKRAVTFVMPDTGGVVVVASGTVPVGDLSDVAVVVVGQGGNPQPGPTVDTLAEKVATLYAADASPTKAADAAKLAGIYRSTVQMAVDAPDLTTTAKLLSVLKDSAGQIVPLPKLKAIREAFADELDAKLGKNPAAPLTPELRATAREQFTRLAGILEGLK